MGKFASPQGVTAFYYDNSGAQVNSQFFAKAKFQGAQRPAGSTVGSDDWLHNIYLADTDAALSELTAQFPSATSINFLTSGSSPGVHFFTSLNGHIQQKTGPFVIATNSNPLKVNETNELHISPVNPESLPSAACVSKL